MKKLRGALLAGTMAALLALPALAAPSYDGVLDPLTGLPPEPGETGSALEGAAYSYDRTQGCYVNPVGSRSFTSSVPNGAVVGEGKAVCSTGSSCCSTACSRGF